MFFKKYLTKNRMLNQTRHFTTVRKELNSILDFITEALASSGLDPKACSRTRFRSEDLTVMLMDHASEGSRLKVTVRKTLGATTVRMVCGGTEFDYKEGASAVSREGVKEMFLLANINKKLEEYRNTPGAVLVDVREVDEFRSGHIPGAINQPLSNISQIKIPKDRTLFVYCLRGSRSRRAGGILKRMGYSAKSIGGITAYKGEIER